METTSARYDRFYTTADLIPGMTYKTLRRSNDHTPITIEFMKHKTGPKQWRFQDELLLDKNFTEKLKTKQMNKTYSKFRTI